MKKYFAAAAMTTLALAACNDEMIDEIADNNNNNNVPACADNSAVLADDVKVYPLLYTNFQNAHDVEITAADTSSMVVKSALLDAMQVELEPGNVISVWTAPEDIPFMRRIEAISKEGGNLRLHTRNVGLDEVLKEAHLEFDSQVYTNADELPRLADGTIAGSASSLYDCVRNAIRFGIAAEEAVTAASAVPARVLGCEGEVGSIAPGLRADFVVCGEDFERVSVWMNGKKL